MFGDGNDNVNDNFLKPWCFDMWRKYIHDRKKWNQALWHMRMFGGKDDLSQMGRAFCKWKQGSKEFLKWLNSLTQEELFNLHEKYRKMLDDHANKIEDAQIEIDDLKTQREYLIDKVVLGQRLALARCRFSFTFAQEKAWVKLYDNSVGKNRAKFEGEIGGALDEIEYLK